MDAVAAGSPMTGTAVESDDPVPLGHRWVSGWGLTFDVCLAVATLFVVACAAGAWQPGQNGAWLAYFAVPTAVLVVLLRTGHQRIDPARLPAVCTLLALAAAVPASLLRVGYVGTDPRSLAVCASATGVVLLLRPWRLPVPPPLRSRAAAAAGALLLGVTAAGALSAELTFDAPRPSRGGEWLGALLLVALFVWLAAAPRFLPRLPLRPALTDGLVVLAILLAVLTFRPHLDAGAVIHQNYYIGPANDVIHGRTVLVDTISQYGVGVIYLFAAVIHVSGTASAYTGTTIAGAAAAAVQCVLVYLLCRRCGVQRSLSAAAVILVIAVALYGQVGSYYYYPSTGMLRFGPALAEALAVSYASGRHRRPALTISLVILAVGAVWSAETLLYTVGVYAAGAIAYAVAAGHDPRDRVRLAAGRLGIGAASVILAVGALCVATRIRGGSWPDWSLYTPYLRAYSVDQFSSAGVLPWTPWLFIAAPEMAGLLIVVRWWQAAWRGRLRADVGTVVAASACVALALLELSYWVARMDENNLRHVATPAIILGAFVLHRARWSLSPVAARVVGAAALAAAGVWLVSATPAIGAKAGDALLPSALDALRGGGPVVRQVQKPQTSVELAAVELMNRLNLPDRVPTLLAPQLQTTALLEAGRTNWFPIPDMDEAKIDPANQGRAREAVARLRPGQWIVVQTPSVRLSPLAMYYTKLIADEVTIVRTVDGGDGVTAELIGEGRPSSAR